MTGLEVDGVLTDVVPVGSDVSRAHNTPPRLGEPIHPSTLADEV